jgi:hypothetical protein
MKYAAVEEIIANLPYPILPTVQGEPDYQTIHAIRKLLQANARAIHTHLGGGSLVHLGIIVSDESYAMIAPATEAGTILWVSPTAPGRDPGNTDGTVAQISAARHTWDEEVQTYRTYTSVQQALKKQIITVFEPIYLEVFNDNMIGFENISTRAMIDHIFITYWNITAVDLENSFEYMRRAWYPQLPVEYLFKQIQDCADYSESGGVLIRNPQQINFGYRKMFANGHFMSACCRWNEKPHAEKLGHNLRPTSPPPTISTGKCKLNLPQHQDTTLTMQLLDKLKNKWPNQPLGHYQTSPQQLQRTGA